MEERLLGQYYYKEVGKTGKITGPLALHRPQMRPNSLDFRFSPSQAGWVLMAPRPHLYPALQGGQRAPRKTLLLHWPNSCSLVKCWPQCCLSGYLPPTPVHPSASWAQGDCSACRLHIHISGRKEEERA